ncbi:MAG: HAD family hydrolase [Cocleimonas sp.]
MIKCVAFDLDNTLWDIDPVIEKAEQRFYQWLNSYYPKITRKYSDRALIKHRMAYMQSQPETLRHDLTLLRKSWMKHLADDVGLDYSFVENGFEIFWLARNEVTFYTDALETLENLSKRYTLGVISNGNASVHHIGIGHLFDYALSSEVAGVAKPHQDIFHQAQKLSNVEAHETVYVGDDPRCDIVGAQNTGMKAIWYNPTLKPWPGGKVPFAVIRSLSELQQRLERYNATIEQ